MSENLADLLEHIAVIGSVHELRYELKCLNAWKRLTAQTLGFGDGDRVTILDSWTPPTTGGWAAKRECLAPGQVGTVRQLVINPDSLRVSALTVWDTEWSVSEWPPGQVRRHSALRNYDDTEDVDRRHLFYFPAEHLRLATADDRPLQMPTLTGASS